MMGMGVMGFGPCIKDPSCINSLLSFIGPVGEEDWRVACAPYAGFRVHCSELEGESRTWGSFPDICDVRDALYSGFDVICIDLITCRPKCRFMVSRCMLCSV
ncbi:hypothetical protein XENOCAPTIV_000924 [Xenoophorus captivus]|uniref:Uncharacterized protein n=1 Tax=Xenoophorus captivus TaxID=1517983 RepID=A0ABV0RG10_9TELE